MSDADMRKALVHNSRDLLLTPKILPPLPAQLMLIKAQRDFFDKERKMIHEHMKLIGVK